ncbi:MAG TPA: hypothetical protein VLW44_00445 [Streptosporangiaceae bacterium]|nr:hypothetical protein [Streptosporangiaceae bacterium]
MVRHTERRGTPRPALLLGVGTDPQQAARVRAEGADLVDVRTATPGALAAIRASLPAAVLWAGPAGGRADAGQPAAEPVDADQLAAAGATAPDGQVPLAAVIATAAVCSWLGAPLIRSRHTRAVRRAIDMTASIAGSRPPSRAIRGLA